MWDALQFTWDCPCRQSMTPKISVWVLYFYFWKRVCCDLCIQSCMYRILCVYGVYGYCVISEPFLVPGWENHSEFLTSLLSKWLLDIYAYNCSFRPLTMSQNSTCNVSNGFDWIGMLIILNIAQWIEDPQDNDLFWIQLYTPWGMLCTHGVYFLRKTLKIIYLRTPWGASMWNKGSIGRTWHVHGWHIEYYWTLILMNK